MVATTADVVGLIATNAGILPVPLAPKPIVVLLFVQVNTVPVTAPVKFIGAVVFPVHTVTLAGCVTVGVGLTVIVKLTAVPAQPAADGVTVMVAVCTVPVALVAMKLAMLPVPEAAKPILVLLLVQLYTVPATAPVKVTAVVGEPLHNIWFAG